MDEPLLGILVGVFWFGVPEYEGGGAAEYPGGPLQGVDGRSIAASSDYATGRRGPQWFRCSQVCTRLLIEVYLNAVCLKCKQSLFTEQCQDNYPNWYGRKVLGLSLTSEQLSSLIQAAEGASEFVLR